LCRRISISLGRYTTVFQAKIYAIYKHAYEIPKIITSEKYICICSDSTEASKSLQVIKMFPLYDSAKQHQMIFPSTTLKLNWIPEHPGVSRNEITHELAREDTAHQFVGPVNPEDLKAERYTQGLPI
jgi:hypothetical protein